jgi:cytochrome c biogenesis protein CcdA/DsbC/DsbD-like thiol-disulfide interchange protein
MSFWIKSALAASIVVAATSGQDLGAAFKGAALDGDVLVLRLQCAPGWHVYPLDGDEANRTKIELVAGPRAIDGAIEQPKTKHHRKEYEGGYVEEYDYLDGEVVFRAKLRATGAPGDEVAGEISWNACNDEGCLPLAKATFKVALKGSGEATTRPKTVATRVIADPKSTIRRRGNDPASFPKLVVPKSVAPGAPFEVALTVRVQPGWHIYGLKSLGGPEQPTRFLVGALEDGPATSVRLDGDTKAAPPPRTKGSGADRYLSHQGETTFTIPLVLEKRPAADVERFALTVAYQTCTDESCLPPAEAAFEVEVAVEGGGTGATATTPETSGTPEKPEPTPPATDTKPATDEGAGRAASGDAGRSSADAPSKSTEKRPPQAPAGEPVVVRVSTRPEKPSAGRPAEVVFELASEGGAEGDWRVSFVDTPEATTDGPARVERRSSGGVVVVQPILVGEHARSGATRLQGVLIGGDVKARFDAEIEILSSLLNFVLLAMAAAGFALLTPCVFPMIPVTVSYFTKQAEKSGGRNPWGLGFTYAFGIVASFTLIGVAFTAALGPAGASVFAQHPITQLAIALLFVVFAASLMGAFEIQLPAFLQNMIGGAQGKGGIGGVLLMGALFSLTTFTCTAAFVGGLLAAAAASGDYMRPVVGMIAFSGVLAIPFIFLSAFPSYLKKLPRSGGWMNEVKVVMGFVELAAALKFLNGWDVDVFTRTVVLVFSTAIFAACGLYLLGAFRMPHDSPREKTSVTHVALALGSLGLAIYLASGIGGQPLAGFIDGYLPVVEKEKDPRRREQALADLVAERLAEGGLVGRAGTAAAPARTGLDRLFDDAFEDAVAESKRAGVPLFIDFTGFT